MKFKLLKQEVSAFVFQNKLSCGGVYFVCSRLRDVLFFYSSR